MSTATFLVGDVRHSVTEDRIAALEDALRRHGIDPDRSAAAPGGIRQLPGAGSAGPHPTPSDAGPAAGGAS